MSQNLTDFVENCTLKEITKNCEKLINRTQVDLETFRNEHIQLKEQIFDILEENSSLNNKLEVLKSTKLDGESQDDATREKFTTEALDNVKKQIDFLQVENKELRALNKSSQRTIQHLESELQNYRNQFYKVQTAVELKQKYTTALKVLESNITKQKSEITGQAQIIENLLSEKDEFQNRTEKLETSLKAKERELTRLTKTDDNTIYKLQATIEELTYANKAYEKQLKQLKFEVDDRNKREKRALQKVQEALYIADTAVKDKDEALKREQVLKEECDNLAATIGQVMDEAAEKVEADMQVMRVKLNKKEQFIIELHEKLKFAEENREKTKALETRCDYYEKKSKNLVSVNAKLLTELGSAIRTLDEMEIKLKENEKYLRENKIAQSRHAKEHERQIKVYIQMNKALKEKYKYISEDVTMKFKEEIIKLQNENASLKAELKWTNLQK